MKINFLRINNFFRKMKVNSVKNETCFKKKY